MYLANQTKANIIQSYSCSQVHLFSFFITFVTLIRLNVSAWGHCGLRKRLGTTKTTIPINEHHHPFGVPDGAEQHWPLGRRVFCLNRVRMIGLWRCSSLSMAICMGALTSVFSLGKTDLITFLTPQGRQSSYHCKCFKQLNYQNAPCWVSNPVWVPCLDHTKPSQSNCILFYFLDIQLLFLI